jgi:hypothetical protein
MITMFQCLNIFRCKQHDPVANELSIELRIPISYQDKAVPTSIIVMELLWQQYGLDVIHPKVSRWLEQNAPDIKFASSDDRTQFKVGPKGTIELHLPLKVDDRLREVSFQYILSQVQHPTEPETAPQLLAA